MATLSIPDDALKEAGLTEAEASIELACRLFDIGRLSLWSAAHVAGLSRTEFESELLNRRIPIYRPTPADLAEDMAALDKLGV